MDPVGCPLWIEPGNAFRVVLKVAKYTADVEYGGLVEMAEQEHELWLDRSIGYNLAQFYDDVAAKIIWGPRQTLSIWVSDTNTGSEWKIIRDDQWQVMMKDKWDERVAHIAVEVVPKDGYERNDSSVASKVSNTGIPLRSSVINLDDSPGPNNAEGTCHTSSSPPQHVDEIVPYLISHPEAMESMKKKEKRTPQTPSSTANGASSDDRISALDNDLCEHILSLARLNVRELVRTSVLSKRWRNLWKRLPVLDFFRWSKLKSAGDVQQYIAIVNDLLEQRAGVTSEARINEVKIPLIVLDDECSIPGKRQQILLLAMEAAERWIRYAMHHQVKGLQLKLCVPPLVKMEYNIEKPVMDLDELLPSSPKLERMCLGLSLIEVQLPRTAVFTSLKELTLEFVELAAGSGHLLARLSSSSCCPSLQKLHMMCIDFLTQDMVVLDAGELLELSMQCVGQMKLLELRTPKLIYLEIDGCVDLESLMVSASGLKELTYFSNIADIHDPLPCLWRLKIDLYLYTHTEEDDDEEDPNRINIGLLKRCNSSVRCLHLHLNAPQEEEQHGVDLIEDNKIPQLPNVTSLWVSIDVECQRHAYGDSVASLLRRSKNLEYLSLQLDGLRHICPKTDECYSEDAHVEPSFTCNNHSHHWTSSAIFLANLRKAEFRAMTGTSCELRFLRFMLANATDLQSVTVSFNLHFIQEDSRMYYFLYMLLWDGTWTACEDEDEDFDKCYKCGKFYKWTPSA